MATYQNVASLIPTPQLTPQLQNQIHKFVNQNPNASQQQISGFLAGQGVLPQSQGQTSKSQQSTGASATTNWSPGTIGQFNQQAAGIARQPVSAGTSRSFPYWGPILNQGQLDQSGINNAEYAEMNKKYSDTFDSRANAIKDLNEYNRYINDYWGGQADDSPFLSKQAYRRSGDSQTAITPSGFGYEKVNYDRLPEVYDPSKNQRYENPAPMYAHGQITQSQQQPYPSGSSGKPPTHKKILTLPYTVKAPDGSISTRRGDASIYQNSFSYWMQDPMQVAAEAGNTLRLAATNRFNNNKQWKIFDKSTVNRNTNQPEKQYKTFQGNPAQALKKHIGNIFANDQLTLTTLRNAGAGKLISLDKNNNPYLDWKKVIAEPDPSGGGTVNVMKKVNGQWVEANIAYSDDDGFKDILKKIADKTYRFPLAGTGNLDTLWRALTDEASRWVALNGMENEFKEFDNASKATSRAKSEEALIQEILYKMMKAASR